MSKVLGIVYRTIASHLIRQANLTRATAHTGAVTLIQRFGSALNLNVHLHMLFLDGVYVEEQGTLTFRRVAPPTTMQLQALLERLAQRIGRHLQRSGWLRRDAESSDLQLDGLDDETTCMDSLRGHSITNHIAIGKHQGRKAFTLQTQPASEPSQDGRVARAAGFSLHNDYVG